MRRAALAAALLLAAAPAAAQISADRIKADVKTLASDAFGGRGPGQPGEAKTVQFLSEQFGKAGLAPGGENGGWTQDVKLIRYDRGPVTMSARVGGATIPLVAGKDVTASSRILGETVLSGAPLVFAGYGIADPAIGWTGFAGADLNGKVAVLIANDPDFEAAAPGAFGGRTLVYAGRFGAKVEAAAKAGAVAVLVVHETAAASYPWSQVGNGDSVPTFGLDFGTVDAKPLGLRGWLHRDVAADLFKRAGLDFEKLKAAARDGAFKPVAIGNATLSTRFSTTATPFVSRNVVALLKGKAHPDETIIYGAHWDANGTGPADAKGDTIRNGAVDNATGTATLIEVARAFAAGPQPDRSILFIGYTAEEKGLLGAEWYAAKPLRPLETTVAVLNLDPHVVLGAARNLDLIGGGRTPLEADLKRIAAKHDLRVDDEANPEAGWYFRSDHFAFAKKGVPTVYFRAGRDLIDGGFAAGNKVADAYNERDYHQTTDEFDAGWSFAGAAQEATVAYEIGRELATSRRWPDWNDGVDFKTVRNRSAAARRP
ncbi:M28 family peptidase [Sphingoaurantiacus capsulatus]|uniref:M28 family peptidase n=1 Tax=Sphingoaurantiacus capsulatus TaxID=1771310 RepID=A0ABV7X7L3_9SPHN